MNYSHCTHGILPHGYIRDKIGNWCFVISVAIDSILVVRSYSTEVPPSRFDLSTRTILGSAFYRMLDVPEFRMPYSMRLSEIAEYACPICMVDDCSIQSSEVVDHILDRAKSHFDSPVGISGSVLLQALDARDCDVVVYGVGDSKVGSESLQTLARVLGLERVSGWRRYRLEDTIFCFYLRQKTPLLDIKHDFWPLKERASARRYQLRVVDDFGGFAFPVIYGCTLCVYGSEAVVGEDLVFWSLRPGHSGLLRVGDTFEASCYDVRVDGQRVLVGDPFDSWVEVL